MTGTEVIAIIILLLMNLVFPGTSNGGLYDHRCESIGVAREGQHHSGSDCNDPVQLNTRELHSIPLE